MIQVDNQWTHRFVQNLNVKILKKKSIENTENGKPGLQPIIN